MPSVLLWNIYNLPSILTATRDSTIRARILAGLLNQYDIVILNEAFINKKFFSTHPHIFVPKSACLTLFDSGLVFLSQFPIIETASQTYHHRAGWDRFAAKSIAGILVEIDGSRVWIYGTHMQAGASIKAQKARKCQAKQVNEIIKSTPGDTIIFAGDLNMGPIYDETYSRFSLHYIDEFDARNRNSAYHILAENAGLIDAWEKTTDDRQRMEICRFLVRGIENYSLDYEDMKANGWSKPLSDTPALCFRW